jgi:hypothetical protein
VPIADVQSSGSFDLRDLLLPYLVRARSRSRSRWFKAIRSVSIAPSATYESGHFYFAQTGHPHFAATLTA